MACRFCSGECRDIPLGSCACGRVCWACSVNFITAAMERNEYVSCDECNGSLTDADLAARIGWEATALYRKRLAMIADHTVRECAACNILLRPIADPERFPDIFCPRCGLHQCMRHSVAHGPGDCWRYQLDTPIVSEDLDARPCPTCGILTLREGGCVHMSCRRCKANWCWECGNLGYAHICADKPKDAQHPSQRCRACLWCCVPVVESASLVVVGLVVAACCVIYFPVALFALAHPPARPCIICCFDKLVSMALVPFALVWFVASRAIDLCCVRGVAEMIENVPSGVRMRMVAKIAGVPTAVIID